MAKRFLFAVLAAALLAGCAALKPPAASGDAGAQGAGAAATAAPTSALGNWLSPAAAYPAICMTMAAGGELRFSGGFTFYNPSRWVLDGARSELRIELGGTLPFPAESAQYQIKQRPASLARIEPAARALVYHVTPSTESIELGGFVFYRKPSCDIPQTARR